MNKTRECAVDRAGAGNPSDIQIDRPQAVIDAVGAVLREAAK